MDNFFAEAKRLHIYAMAVAYVVAAFILLQLAGTVARLLHLPDWAGTLLLIVLLVVFPVVFIFSSTRVLPSDGTFAPSKDIADKFQQAQSLHGRGKLGDAEVLYRAVLVQMPKHSDALHMLGIIASQTDQHAAALELIERAIAVNPNLIAAHVNRAGLLQALRRPEEALASCDRVVQLKPDYAEAFNQHGNVLFELKRLDEALSSYARAIELKPDFAEPFNNRGTTLRNLKRPVEALFSYDRAIELKPGYAEAFYNRANALLDLERLDDALLSYDRAISLKPDYAEAFYNRGNLLLELKRPGEALASYDRVLELNAKHEAAFNNRGTALSEVKRLKDAIESFDRALRLKPDYAAALYNRGVVELLLGHYREGWVDYECRWDKENCSATRAKINAPTWKGENLTECRIAVYGEQGLGDTIQFVRYLPLLMQKKAKVTFLSPACLVRLLRPVASQVEIVTSIDDRQPFDFQCALMSLPLRFGTELSSIPSTVPYLTAEKDLVSRWREKIANRGFKIGIAWQGARTRSIDRGRSIPLAGFLPLCQIPGVRLISLQKNHGLDQLTSLPTAMHVETLGDEFDSRPDAFIDTAAVMSNLDLIITLDTSIAHLAGALGCPTWVALKYVPDWRWLLDRKDSPWYPTMRLFRQETDGDWNFVFAKIAQELRSCLLERQSLRDATD